MEEGKYRMMMAVFCRDLNKQQICPGNHVLDYDRGWFYIDGKTVERCWAYKMRREAIELLEQGFVGAYAQYPNRHGNGAPYWYIE